MTLEMRLLLGLLSFPFRLVAWLFRRLYVLVRGYDVLTLRLDGAIRDKRGAASFATALLGESRGAALLDLIVALERAARDDRLQAVFVEIGPLSAGLARADEVRAALARVRDAGKRVVVYMEEAGLGAHFVALGGTEIVLAPGGALNLTGVASEVVFLKGALDRIGIRSWLRARGKYKSARETFGESEMTAANREMTEALVGDLYEQLVGRIASSRRLSPDDVRARLDTGPFLASEAQALGFVDTVAYRDEVEQALKESVGKWRSLSLDAYLRLSTHLMKRGKGLRVALVDVKGAIKSGASVPGRSGVRATGSRHFIESVDALAEDPRVQAIVLRVDSPGGSALASDSMWRALTRASKSKPLVVSMVDVAASGGYFVAGIRGATIFASPTTITGSIGVLAGKFDASLLYERLGIKKELVARGRRAGFFSEARPFTEDDLAKLEADLDAHYGHFLARMAEGRGRTVEEIRAVAEGRVWTGRQALANGLVDAHGGLAEALAKVRTILGKDPDAPLRIVRPRVGRRGLPVRIAWRGANGGLPELLARPLALAEYFSGERVLALLPFDIRLE